MIETLQAGVTRIMSGIRHIPDRTRILITTRMSVSAIRHGITLRTRGHQMKSAKKHIIEATTTVRQKRIPSRVTDLTTIRGTMTRGTMTAGKIPTTLTGTRKMIPMEGMEGTAAMEKMVAMENRDTTNGVHTIPGNHE